MNETTTLGQQQATFAVKGRHLRLLEDPQVNRWYQNLKRGSEITAEVWLRRLGLFCEQVRLTPSQLIEKDPATITDILDDTITLMEQSGKAPGYIKGMVTSVRSWLAHYGIKPTRRLKIKDAEIPVTLQGEKVPDAETLAKMLLMGSLKRRTIKQILAKSGVRPQSLGNYKGTDGIRLSDLPELAITAQGCRFLQHPARLIIRRNLSKAGHQYFTFLTTSARQAIETYLNERQRKGETLSPDTPLIPAEHNHSRFIRTSVIGREVRRSLRPIFNVRPYIFRAFFDTQLLVAEAQGKVPHDFRVFWMGHKGSMEARYTTNKCQLPDSLLNEIREAFKRAEPYLDLERVNEDPVEKQRQEVAKKIGQLSPENLSKVAEIISKMTA